MGGNSALWTWLGGAAVAFLIALAIVITNYSQFPWLLQIAQVIVNVGGTIVYLLLWGIQWIGAGIGKIALFASNYLTQHADILFDPGSLPDPWTALDRFSFR